ncbi:hypothetical protein OJ253_2184 [Cryptosporidium canis]|uniref:Uncharacterized protein n=1 Tax=Cryptosporidium canis TaxID=195482 RepID=A0A9D5HV48_9CRYT|nr:hypothetical protein OJ253_2184 [Cryptosporidium canis]
MEDHEKNIKDELQAYYGDELLAGSNGVEHENNNKPNSKNGNLLNIDFSKEDFNVDKVFEDILETSSIKELFLIERELNIKIQKCQIEMQEFIHSNYKKLQSISNIFDNSSLTNKEDNSQNSCANFNKLFNDVSKCKNMVSEKLQDVKNDIFTNENNENLEKYLNQYNLFMILSELKRFHLILDDYFSKQDYQQLIQLYNEWKKPLEILSDDDNFKSEFQPILVNSNQMFERTINILKNQIYVNINKDLILPNFKSITKSYILLSQGGVDFKNDLISIIDNLFQDIVNEIVIKQLESLDAENKDKMDIFSNTCKQSYQEIFIPLNLIISELNLCEIDPVVPSSILENLFQVSFTKIMELMEHLLSYQKNNPRENLNFQPILQGFEYLDQSIKELIKSLILANFEKNPYFSKENCAYLIIHGKCNIDNPNDVDDYYNNTDCAIKRKYIEWKKSILNDFLKIENLDLSIKEIWNDIFDIVVTHQNSGIETLFTEMNKSIFNKHMNYDLLSAITRFKELINIDFEVCENLVRKLIKDAFQTIISDSMLYINCLFFNNIINSGFDLNSIKDRDQVMEKIHLELSFSLNDKDTLDQNSKDSIVDRFSLLNYKQKSIFFLSIIILIRYLRDKSLYLCISTFYDLFYSSNEVNMTKLKSLKENVGLIDLFGSNKSHENLDDDATIQIIRILYERFEILFLNMFVIWNIYAIIQETHRDLDVKDGEKIHVGNWIDLLHSNVTQLFRFCDGIFESELFKSNHLKKSGIPEFQFPIRNLEKSIIFAKWSNNYRILQDFDLNNNTLINKPISFWLSQILHGILIEMPLILKNDSFIIVDSTNSYEKSLSEFWNSILHYLEYSIDFNITHSLFCNLYNTLLSTNT